MLSKAEGMQDDPKVLQVLCRCFALSLLYPYESAAGKFQVVVADAVLLMEARICRQICRAVAQIVVCGLPARRLVNNFLQAQITISPLQHVHRLRDHTVQVQASSWLVFSTVKNRFGNVERMMCFMEVARMVIIRAEPRPLV